MTCSYAPLQTRRALSTGITLNSTVTPYTMEPAGTVSATGYDTQSISATRAAYYYNQLADMKAQVRRCACHTHAYVCVCPKA